MSTVHLSRGVRRIARANRLAALLMTEVTPKRLSLTIAAILAYGVLC